MKGKKAPIFLLVVGFIFFNLVPVKGLEGESGMKITSSEFEHSQFLPVRFSCDGAGVNPPLVIENIPTGAQSLALIVDDPDAPGETFVHWVVFDIPVVSQVQIQEDSIPGKQGINSAARKDYVSPCPPSGIHRYYFKVYCLDAMLNLKEGITRDALEDVMQGHILEKAELIGLYQRKK